MSWLCASEEGSAELCRDDGFVPSCRLLPSCFASKRIFSFNFSMKITVGPLPVKDNFQELVMNIDSSEQNWNQLELSCIPNYWLLQNEIEDGRRNISCRFSLLPRKQKMDVLSANIDLSSTLC